MVTAANNGVANEVDPNTKLPFLQRVCIRGYKSIAFCDVRLEPLTLLVGRNAAGKSNFLDALAFVRDALATNIPEAAKRHGDWPNLLSHFSTTGEISFEIEVSLPPLPLSPPATVTQTARNARYGFTLKEGPVPESPVLVREWLQTLAESGASDCHYQLTGTYDHARKAMGYTWDFHHPEIACSQVPYPRPDRLWIGSFGQQPFLGLEAGLRSMAFYDFIPQAMRPPQPLAPGRLLDRNGWNLASVIEATRENDRRAIDRVGRYLTVITESVELRDVDRYGGFETVRFRVLRAGQGEPLDFKGAQMSDGTLRALAALVAAFQIVPPHGSPSIVAIEEPEAALHPAAMRALVDALDEATLRTQILLTTHSADMLDNPTVQPANIRVVQQIDGQTIIGPVDEANVEIVRRQLNTLGGLERENQLEPDLEDQQRQRHLAQTRN